MDAPDEVTGGDCRPFDIVWYTMGRSGPAVTPYSVL